MTTATITQGWYEGNRYRYFGSNSDTWTTLASTPYQTWSNWRTWASNAQSLILQLDDDLGSIGQRAPTINLRAQGQVTLQLKISQTGTFTGEETTINFVPGTAYTFVSGRYYRWIVTIATDSAVILPVLEFYQTSYIDNVTQDIYYTNLDTTTLSGTTSSRSISGTWGSILNVLITARRNTAWVDRAYSLPDTYVNQTDFAPIPSIISTSSTLQFALLDHFTQPVDGVVDIAIKALPKITQSSSQSGVTTT